MNEREEIVKILMDHGIIPEPSIFEEVRKGGGIEYLKKNLRKKKNI